MGLFSGNPRLMSSGFVVCFGVLGWFWPNLEVVKWIEPGLFQGGAEVV